jgi:hypothetical protein
LAFSVTTYSVRAAISEVGGGIVEAAPEVGTPRCIPISPGNRVPPGFSRPPDGRRHSPWVRGSPLLMVMRAESYSP